MKNLAPGTLIRLQVVKISMYGIKQGAVKVPALRLFVRKGNGYVHVDDTYMHAPTFVPLTALYMYDPLTATSHVRHIHNLKKKRLKKRKIFVSTTLSEKYQEREKFCCQKH